MKKLNIFETNKYIYIQKDKDGNRFKHLFPDAEEVTMDWQNTIMPNKSSFFIVPNTERKVFDYIEPKASEYICFFADVDTLEDEDFNDLRGGKMFEVGFFLPFYDYELFNRYLSNWLLDVFASDRGNLHTDFMSEYADGLNAIVKPLWKYIGSLLSNLDTRKKGLKEASCLFITDRDDTLLGLCHEAGFKLNHKPRGPRPRKNTFDPDAFIRNRIDSAKEPYDPDDEAF